MRRRKMMHSYTDNVSRKVSIEDISQDEGVLCNAARWA